MNEASPHPSIECPFCQAKNPSFAETCISCGRALNALTAGTVLAGRYEILHQIGKGGMGFVFKAHDQVLDEIVALKVLRGEVMGSPEIERRFRSEIKLARKVHHRNVCGIHEYGQFAGFSFIAMEFLEGINLKQLLQEKAPLPVAYALDIAVQVASGLEAVHEAGIVHRDLKTPNIMVDTRGAVRLMDFGIAKSLFSSSSSDNQTMAGQIVGTPEYMSPEQARGERVDTRSDLYAFGIVLFELFTGAVPFRGDSPIDTFFKQIQESPPVERLTAVGAPPSLTPVILKALAKNPEDRYQTVAELMDALRQVRETLPEGQPLLIPLGEPAPPDAALGPLPVSPTVAVPGVRPPPARAPVPPPPPPYEEAWRTIVMSGPAAARLPSPTPLPMPRVDPAPGRSKPAPPASAPTASQRLSWSSVAHALPAGMVASEDAVRGLLASVFGGAILVKPGLLRLHEPKLPGSEGYTFFALFMGESIGGTDDSGEHLGTGTFVAYASPLELHLATLPAEERKAVVVVADAFELGRGVRERILHYRKQFNAVVVPLCLDEVRKAHREGTLRALVDDRLADLHTPRDLFRARGASTDPTTFFGMRDELNQLVTVLQHPDAFVVISGPPGSGKSSLVRMAENGLRSARFWHVPCAHLTRRTVAGFVDDVVAVLTHSPDDITTIIDVASMTSDPSLPADQIPLRLARAAREAAASAGGRPVLVLEDANWLIELLYATTTDERRAGRELWATLAASARSRLVSIVVTGVRAFLLSQRVIDGWDNPLASQATVFAVPPLGAASVRRMISELAVQMNTRFDSRALEDVYHLSGGNVEVVRHLCSAAMQANRRERENASLAPILIDRKRVRRAAEKLAAERSTFRSLDWLGQREREVLCLVATHRPSSARAVRRLLPEDARPMEVAEALERLRHMGLVEHRDGRERVAIPLLEAWVRENEEVPGGGRHPPGEIRYRWLVLGLTTTVVLCVAYWSWYRTATVTTQLARVGACQFEIQHPNRSAEGQPVTMAVSGECRDLTTPPDVRLLRELGTIARANGQPAAWFPATLTCTAGQCEGEVKVELASTRTKHFEFRAHHGGQAAGQVRIEYDPWVRRKQELDRIVQLLLAIPSLLGTIGTFYDKMRGVVAGSLSMLQGH